MEVDRSNLTGKRGREEEVDPEAVPMPLDSNVAHLIPYVPNSAPAVVSQPEQQVVDEVMEDRVQVEASETLGRRIVVKASDAGAVVAEQLVSRREISVSTPQEQVSVSEEREVRAVQAVAFGSSGESSDPMVPRGSFELRGAQIARRTLRLDQISGGVETEEEEHWRSAVRGLDWGGLEPETWGPEGETLPQPSEGPSSLAPRDDLMCGGRASLPCPEVSCSLTLRRDE